MLCFANIRVVPLGAKCFALQTFRAVPWGAADAADAQDSEGWDPPNTTAIATEPPAQSSPPVSPPPPPPPPPPLSQPSCRWDAALANACQ
eukprot:242032-Amphidinium_carterae.1